MPRLFAVVVLIAAGLSSPALAQGDANAERCGNYRLDADLRIGACTALIQSGQESDRTLAGTFNDRATAYYDKGAYDLAIRDYALR